MAEVVSELDKLREAAKLIEEMSQGRLQVCPSVVGQVYIRPENEAYLGLDMRINSIPGQLYAHDRGSDSISGRTVGGTGSKVIPNFESDDIKGG